LGRKIFTNLDFMGNRAAISYFKNMFSNFVGNFKACPTGKYYLQPEARVKLKTFKNGKKGLKTPGTSRSSQLATITDPFLGHVS